MAWKTGRILGAFLSCMISLASSVTAQESTYSADSLMATFEKGSKVSPKGAQIALRGIVAENKNSKLVFRSSLSYRVICELAPGSVGQQSRPPSVGSEITVIGKVKGRGLLGNVTLDNCSLAPIAAATVPTEPAPEELATPSPDPPSEEDSPVAYLPRRREEPKKEEPRKQVETQSVRPAKTRTPPVKADIVAPVGVEHQDQKTNTSSEPRNDLPYRFYALLVLGGAVSYAILAKLLGSALRTMRHSGPSSSVNTPEVRQAALEALLLKASKEKINSGGGRLR
jgi:hypothetical protein